MNVIEKLVFSNGLKLASLKINVVEEGIGIIEVCKKIGFVFYFCIRVNFSSLLVFVNFYYKVGYGILDMYVLNLVVDSKELKEFL